MHTADLNRSFELQEDRLVDKDLASFCAKELDLMLQKLYGLPWTVSSY